MYWFCQFDMDKVLSGFDTHKRKSLKGMLKSDDLDSVYAAIYHLIKFNLIKWDTYPDNVHGDQDILVAI